MSLFRRKPEEYFSQEEKSLILEQIHTAEHGSSGEVRVYIENRCRFVNPVDRAKEIFEKLHMEATRQRNAVLLYVAMKDKQLAIWGDQGIHDKVGDAYWNGQVKTILQHFRKENHAAGIADMVKEIGTVLGKFFPHIDGIKNELPDDIVFGR